MTKILHSHLGNEKHIVKKLQPMSLEESMFSLTSHCKFTVSDVDSIKSKHILSSFLFFLLIPLAAQLKTKLYICEIFI